MKKIIALLCMFPVFVFSQDKVLENQNEDFREYKKVEFAKTEKNQLKDFRVTEDKFQSTVYIHSRKEPDSNMISIYLGITDNEAFIRLRTNYSGSRWIFYDRVTVNIGAQNYTIMISDLKRETHSAGNVTERSDMLVSEDLYKVIMAISRAKEDVELRFKGEKVKDIKLSKKTIESIRETLALYHTL